MGVVGVTWAGRVGAVASLLCLSACAVDRLPLGTQSAGGAGGTFAGSGGTGGISGTGGIAGSGGTGGISGTGGIAGSGGTGGIAGSGGTGGIAGSGGTGGIAGSGGAGGIAGSAGVGGTSGTGGTGGSVPFCATSEDKRSVGECGPAAEGWFAVKTTLDVWWQGIPTRDPGRGDIIIYLLSRISDVCQDGSNANVEVRACGARLPAFTSDVACDAFQIEFPDEMWDSPRMPRFYTRASVDGFNPGNILSIARATGLVGIDLFDGQEDGTWPTANDTGTFGCEAGSGEACFPDHDNDGLPGVTIRLRTDQQIHVGNVGDGKCSTGTEFLYRGAPTGPDIAAGGGAGGGVRASKVQIGLRTRLSGAGEIDDNCRSGVGSSDADFLDSRALACEVSPASLGAFDPRMSSGNYACRDDEAQFVDDNVPIYRVLQAGEIPGDSNKPNGWRNNPILGTVERDISKHMSVGPKSALVRLANLQDPSPSCETVRNTVYPAN